MGMETTEILASSQMKYINKKRKKNTKKLTLKAENFLKFKEGAYYNYYSYVTFINKISFTMQLYIHYR